MPGISRYVEDLIRSRRPRRFRASEEDAELARTAITLRAARPGGDARDEFVTSLHKRLAAELDPPATRSVSRRGAFLRIAAITTGAAAVGAAIDYEITARTQPGVPAEATTLTPTDGDWTTVTVSEELPDGAVRPFNAGPVTGFVERVEGQLRAVSGICTHQGCRLTLDSRPALLVCPCHGATFKVDGTVLTHPFPTPLPPLPELRVREVNGAIQVYAPAALLFVFVRRPGGSRGSPDTVEIMASERVPIGRGPGLYRNAGCRTGQLYPFGSQRAWLEGSVLIVERRQQVRQCDLRTASHVGVRGDYIAGGSIWAFLILEARQEAADEPVRLVLRGPGGWILLAEEHLRVLARIIGSRPGEPGRNEKKALRTLNDLADYQKSGR